MSDSDRRKLALKDARGSSATKMSALDKIKAIEEKLQRMQKDKKGGESAKAAKTLQTVNTVKKGETVKSKKTNRGDRRPSSGYSEETRGKGGATRSVHLSGGGKAERVIDRAGRRKNPY